jgi:hypothetical protein
MFVANISFQVDPQIETAWLDWVQQTFIPNCLTTDCFIQHQLYQLDLTQDQPPTYTLQLFSKDAAVLANFHEKHLATLLLSITSQWGEQCFYFNTSMKIVN